MKHPNIVLKLSEEEAAVIPYELGQTVKFLNQDGDTLSFQVLRDQTYPYNGEQYYNAIFGGDVYHPSRYYCYARTVVLDREEGGILGFTILPQKEFYFFYFVNGSKFELNCHLLPITNRFTTKSYAAKTPMKHFTTGTIARSWACSISKKVISH